MLAEVGIAAWNAREWSVEVPGADEDWRVGLGVGPSESGKSTLAREGWPDALVGGYDLVLNVSERLDVLVRRDRAGAFRVRFVFQNSTGMDHPLHLHGHSFRVPGKPGR